MVSTMSPAAESLARRYDAVRPHLTERQRRVWLGAEARELGSGGVRIVAHAVGSPRDAVRRGRDELDDPQPLEVGRSRGPGGGRKRAEELNADLLAGALDRLVDQESRDDPMTPVRWTSKSLQMLDAAGVLECPHLSDGPQCARRRRSPGVPCPGPGATCGCGSRSRWRGRGRAIRGVRGQGPVT